MTRLIWRGSGEGAVRPTGVGTLLGAGDTDCLEAIQARKQEKSKLCLHLHKKWLTISLCPSSTRKSNYIFLWRLIIQTSTLHFGVKTQVLILMSNLNFTVLCQSSTSHFGVTVHVTNLITNMNK